MLRHPLEVHPKTLIRHQQGQEEKRGHGRGQKLPVDRPVLDEAGVGVGALVVQEAVADVHGGEGEDGEGDGEGHPDDGVDPQDDVEQVVLPQHEDLEERVEEHLGVAPLGDLPEQGGLRLTLLDRVLLQLMFHLSRL